MRRGFHVHKYTARWRPRSGVFVVQICEEARPANERDRAMYEPAYLDRTLGFVNCGDTRVIFPALGLAVRGPWPDRVRPATIARAIAQAKRVEHDRRRA